MEEYPAGYELKSALRSLRCQSCVHQCMIAYLVRQAQNLQYKISSLENK